MRVNAICIRAASKLSILGGFNLRQHKGKAQMDRGGFFLQSIFFVFAEEIGSVLMQNIDANFVIIGCKTL